MTSSVGAGPSDAGEDAAAAGGDADGAGDEDEDGAGEEDGGGPDEIVIVIPHLVRSLDSVTRTTRPSSGRSSILSPTRVPTGNGSGIARNRLCPSATSPPAVARPMTTPAYRSSMDVSTRASVAETRDRENDGKMIGKTAEKPPQAL
jgi:hypothetical protein